MTANTGPARSLHGPRERDGRCPEVAAELLSLQRARGGPHAHALLLQKGQEGRRWEGLFPFL